MLMTVRYSHEAWEGHVCSANSHEAWKGHVCSTNSHEAWKGRVYSWRTDTVVSAGEDVSVQDNLCKKSCSYPMWDTSFSTRLNL